MYLKDLIEAAKKGAILRHSSGCYNVRLDHNTGAFYGEHGKNRWDIKLSPESQTDSWQIETPHPGACTECRGLKAVEVCEGHTYPSIPVNGELCQHCHGTGDEPTPKERDEAHKREICERIVEQKSCKGINCVHDACPFNDGRDSFCCQNAWTHAKIWIAEHPKPAVITVRIKGCSRTKGWNTSWYHNRIGDVFKVGPSTMKQCEIEYEAYPVLDNDPIISRHIRVEEAEEIPDYDTTKFRLRRKWGKDEELVVDGDRFWHNDGWRESKFCTSPRHQCTDFIYITPLKPTPDPSADCLNDTPEPYRAKKHRTFIEDLTSLLNIQSEENGSNTPDFILAQYLEGCLRIYESAVQQRETWHGRDPRPSHTRYGVEMAKQNTEINPESPEGGE